MTEHSKGESQIRVVAFSELDHKEFADFIDWDVERVYEGLSADHFSFEPKEDIGYYCGVTMYVNAFGIFKERIRISPMGMDSIQIENPETVEFNEAEGTVTILGDGEYFKFGKVKLEFSDEGVVTAVDYSGRRKLRSTDPFETPGPI